MIPLISVIKFFMCVHLMKCVHFMQDVNISDHFVLYPNLISSGLDLYFSLLLQYNRFFFNTMCIHCAVERFAYCLIFLLNKSKCLSINPPWLCFRFLPRYSLFLSLPVKLCVLVALSPCLSWIHFKKKKKQTKLNRDWFFIFDISRRDHDRWFPYSFFYIVSFSIISTNSFIFNFTYLLKLYNLRLLEIHFHFVMCYVHLSPQFSLTFVFKICLCAVLFILNIMALHGDDYGSLEIPLLGPYFPYGMYLRRNIVRMVLKWIPDASSRYGIQSFLHLYCYSWLEKPVYQAI